MTILLGDYPIVLLLVLFRVAALIFMLPFFGIMRGNRMVLAGAAMPTALLFCTTLPDSFREGAALLQTPGDVMWALLGEALLGAAIGAVVGAFVGAFTTAGIIVARGTSLAMAEEIDPTTGDTSGTLPQIYQMMFLVLILAFDAHLVLIKLVALSFHHVSVPWMGWMRYGFDIAQLGGTTLHLGVSLSMPVLVVGTLVTIAMALMARFAEEFNVLFLSIPFRIVAGFYIMGLSILLGDEVFRSVAQQMLTTVSRFLAS